MPAVTRGASVLLCLVLALLLIVLVDGWAVNFLPRAVEKILLSVAFVFLFALVVAGLMGRGGGTFLTREDEQRLD
jgi:hypothetical protein